MPGAQAGSSLGEGCSRELLASTEDLPGLLQTAWAGSEPVVSCWHMPGRVGRKGTQTTGQLAQGFCGCRSRCCVKARPGHLCQSLSRLLIALQIRKGRVGFLAVQEAIALLVQSGLVFLGSLRANPDHLNQKTLKKNLSLLPLQ